MAGEEMEKRKERMKSDCRKIMESINAMGFENINDEQVHSLVMMREIARGVVDNRAGMKVSGADVNKALSSSIDTMVESCRDVVSILGRVLCEGLGEEEFRKLMRMKEIAMEIVMKRSTPVATVAVPGGGGRQVDGGDAADDDDESEKYMYSIGVEDDGNEARQGVVDGDIQMWNGYLPVIEGEGTESKMVEDYREVVSRDEDGWNVGSVVEGTGDGGRQEQSSQVEGLMFEDDCLLVVSEFETHDVKSEVQRTLSPSAPRISISWPSDGVINLEWVQLMMFSIGHFSCGESSLRFCDVIPVPLVDKLIDTASSILCNEPNCVEVDCQGEGSSVVVVGDIYGQFSDLLHLFEHAGLPSDNQLYVFNGNYVDRGAQGLDVFLVLLAWKVLMPSKVYLLRVNHESKYCTTMYGFEEEVKAKYGYHGEYVYSKCLNCFKELPLASVIANSVYTTHGGLFRSVESSRKSKRKREESLELGSLEDLSKVKRSLIDAPDVGPDVLLTDALWSDPSKEDGLVEKTFRERGLWWGPDCTEAFLRNSNLKLIIRSHEGPDARENQDDFGDMLSGYSVDHVGESGKLYTLFSAPDYPQCGEKRYKNKGVYALFRSPVFGNPSFHSFKDAETLQADADGDKDLVIVDKPGSVTVSSAGVDSTQLVEVLKAPVLEGLSLPLEVQVVDVSGCNPSLVEEV